MGAAATIQRPRCELRQLLLSVNYIDNKSLGAEPDPSISESGKRVLKRYCALRPYLFMDVQPCQTWNYS